MYQFKWVVVLTLLWMVSPFSNIIFRLLRGTVGVSTSLGVHFSIGWSLSLNSWTSVDSSGVSKLGSKGCCWWFSVCREYVLGSGDLGVSAGCSQSCFRRLRLPLRMEGVDFSGDCIRTKRISEEWSLPGFLNFLSLTRRDNQDSGLLTVLIYS